MGTEPHKMYFQEHEDTSPEVMNDNVAYYACKLHGIHSKNKNACKS